MREGLAQDSRDVETAVDGTLEALPPERVRPIERRAAEEERRRRAGDAQCGQRGLHVRREVVVEGESQRKALATTTRTHGTEQLSCGHQAVPPANVSELRLEQCVVVCSSDVSLGAGGPSARTAW